MIFLSKKSSKKSGCPFRYDMGGTRMQYTCLGCSYEITGPFEYEKCPRCGRDFEEGSSSNIYGILVGDSDKVEVRCRVTEFFCVGEDVCPILKK